MLGFCILEVGAAVRTCPKILSHALSALLIASTWALSNDDPLPDTGISGVYEVMVGTASAEELVQYFHEFGFRIVADARVSNQVALKLYGVESALRSVRMQNGAIDSHGLLRILEWDKPLGPGVGYAPPETVGQRMSVMRTHDIFRLNDVFLDLRTKAKQAWNPTPPVFDDLYQLDSGKVSISDRRVGVRESAVYGKFFNHVFFQRYGYTIPGYGTIHESAPLQTSEFTHHDFIVAGDLAEVTDYYTSVLGLLAENDPVIDGDWQPGPQRVFQMGRGESHWYRGFVSPNNVCGKLKFFSAIDPTLARNRSLRQRVGEIGITLHSLYTPKLADVHQLADDHGLAPSPIHENEFSESSFVFKGPDGATWQILAEPEVSYQPVTKFEIISVNN